MVGNNKKQFRIQFFNVEQAESLKEFRKAYASTENKSAKVFRLCCYRLEDENCCIEHLKDGIMVLNLMLCLYPNTLSTSVINPDP